MAIFRKPPRGFRFRQTALGMAGKNVYDMRSSILRIVGRRRDYGSNWICIALHPAFLSSDL
ncbi:hypothetical protein [Rhizobium sp.]|uniref:hypothetical protein n=1 Tax=Rhizobium sp. TaxID=391 RepID=UPI0028A74F46